MKENINKKGILLVNHGSPDSWSVKDIRSYLKNLLMDSHAMEVSPLLRHLFIRMFVFPSRSMRIAKAYREIWLQEGPPLLVYSQKIRKSLEKKTALPVYLGMLYGKPSIEEGIKALLKENVQEIILIAMYPQYARATFGAAIDKSQEVLKQISPDSELKVIPPFYNHPAYLQAMVTQAAPYLRWNFDHLLFSFQGVPEKHIKLTDPTGKHCLKVKKCCATPSPAHETCYRHQTLLLTSTLAKLIKLPREKYSIAFKTKFENHAWLKPYTLPEIERLAKSGVKKLLVIAPSFVADCKETLAELGIRGKAAFLKAGGEEFRLIRSLNDNPHWIGALNEFITDNTPDFLKPE